VIDFREHLQAIKLLRRYKGALRPTRMAVALRDDEQRLWQYLADELVMLDDPYIIDASVVVLVYAASSETEIDMGGAARVLTDLGWRFRDDAAVSPWEVWPIWNDLWTVLGNVSERVEAAAEADEHPSRGRQLSRAARELIRDALFASADHEE
jgi:hypothetical protein